VTYITLGGAQLQKVGRRVLGEALVAVKVGHHPLIVFHIVVAADLVAEVSVVHHHQIGSVGV